MLREVVACQIVERTFFIMTRNLEEKSAITINTRIEKEMVLVTIRMRSRVSSPI